MSGADQGSTYKDPSPKPGSSFAADAVSVLGPASQDTPKISFLLHTMSSSGPASQSSSTLSIKQRHFETADQGQTLKDSSSAYKPECEVTSSFLSFSMSRTSPSSRELLPVPKQKTHLMASFLSISTADQNLSSGSQDSFDAQRLVPHRSNFSSFPDQIQKHMQAFRLSKKQLLQIKDSIQVVLEKGLKKKVQDGAGSLPMVPTFVCTLPNGTERGHFLGLGLSQTQVDVLLLNLSGEEKQKAQLKMQSFPVSAELSNGKLFEYLAKCLARFLEDLHTTEKYFPLGFSFPFHCQHSSLNQCKLIKWAKDFQYAGVVGEDVAQLLQTALKEHCKNYSVEVIAVLNNTVGVMVSCICEEQPCEIGLMIDDGTNCCYMEEAENIASVENKVGCMCINTEWGTFGDAGELDDILTEFDQLMDKESFNQGISRFDKLVGRMYLCEIVRIILATLSEKGELFSGVLSPTLLVKGMLKFQDFLDIIDEKVGLTKTKNFLTRHGLVPSNQDCFHVQQICQNAFIRSANLCAAGLAAIITHIRTSQNQPLLDISVAVSGAVYRGQTQYREEVQKTLKFLIPECKVTFVTSEGSTTGAALVAAAALRLKSQQQQISSILAPLQLSTADLAKIRNQLRQEMEKGLSKETHNIASVRMLPSFVRNLPDGSERGDFLALDLGGTNFRVLLVQVKSQQEGGVCMTSEIYTIPTEVAQSNDVELFDHIVSCIVDFQLKHGVKGQTLPLGFTFSFPCNQIGLDKGILLRWTKGFSALGCVGKDVVQLLREAVKRQKHFDLDVIAIVNDTVGTMMSCAYVDPKCEMGLIVGTGTNACYMEEMQNVGTVEGEEGRMCINMEWGAFGDDGCLEYLMTPYDKKVDAGSINSGQQRYEKLISGMYLGEIVRYILLDLSARKILFQGRQISVLKTKDLFSTKLITTIADGSQGQQVMRAALEEKGFIISAEETLLVKDVCEAVSTRAAKMCGAGVAAVVDKIRENRQLEKLEVTVGVDGTLYKMHPQFARQVQETVALLAPKCQVKFLLSEDGSGKGAALIAAVASLKNKQQLT
ncbi:hexokinase-3 [Eublepharis macularius]|uniref:Hexokinase-2 n=1 Tax=Eublepharis macularius TaxID=481883 RepID=A0AA97J664_EUBMA|nr:hexokinase-3 [Eublepharis macularius]